MRHQARVSSMFRPVIAGRPDVDGSARLSVMRLPALSPALLRSLGLGAVGVAALLGLALAVVLLTVRATHAERIFPAVTVADVPVGGMTIHQAAAALARDSHGLNMRVLPCCVPTTE